MLQYDDAPELSTDHPRFIGDNEADAPLGTGYEAWLDATARALPRQDDDPSIPF